MASEGNSKSNTQSQHQPFSTRSQARHLAEGIVNDVFDDALRKELPEVVKSPDFTPEEKPTVKPDETAPVSNNVPVVKSSVKLTEPPEKSSSHEYKTPPDDAFYTPPISTSTTDSKDDIKVLYQHNDLPKQKQDPKIWHESEVARTIKETRKTSLNKPSGKKNGRERSSENLPLLPRDAHVDLCELAKNSSEYPSMRRKSSGWRILNFFTGQPHLMSSKFSNKEYRQNFASKMLAYKTLHMLTGYLAAILFQMTWTWEREIQKLGPPDLVRLVDDHFWLAYVVLAAYIGLIVAVRSFYVGRNSPFNKIVFVSFTVMFGFKCYAACIGLGQLGAAIITTVTYTLCLSYGLLSIMFICKKWSEKMDLSKDDIYSMVLPVIVITSLLSCVLNYIELKITDSAFQKQIGTMGSIFEDYLPSTIIAFIILMWEVFRIKKIVEGSVVSLLADDEFLFGAFFI